MAHATLEKPAAFTMTGPIASDRRWHLLSANLDSAVSAITPPISDLVGTASSSVQGSHRTFEVELRMNLLDDGGASRATAVANGVATGTLDESSYSFRLCESPLTFRFELRPQDPSFKSAMRFNFNLSEWHGQKLSALRGLDDVVRF